MNGDLIMLAVIGIYLLFLIGIGLKVSKKNATMGDFYLGGRSLGPIITAMSAEASDMSSYLLMGLPGLAYLTGIADVGWTCIGLALGTYLNWLLVAKRLRRYTEVTNSITVPAYFSNRYHDEKRILQMIAAIWIIVFFVPYTASGFAACGKLFNSLFGLEYHTAMLISAAVIILYTSTGGFLAASITDLIQSIIMTVALFAILFFAINEAGGMGNVISHAESLSGYLGFSSTHNPVTGNGEAYTFLTVISTLAWGLGYFGMPHILLRFMAIEHENKITTSRRIASVWVVISMSIAILIGVVGRCLSSESILPMLSGNASETVITKLAHLLSNEGLFAAIVAGLVIAGILACTMSTSDSQLLATSSSVSSDLLTDVMHQKYSEKTLLNISRSTLLVISLIAMCLAWDSDSSVFGIVSFAWAGFGASFGPAVLLSLFWKRSNRQGCFAGMLSGGIMIFVWKFLVRPLGGAWDIYELLPAFLIALLINVLVSLATPQPDESVLSDYRKASQKR